VASGRVTRRAGDGPDQVYAKGDVFGVAAMLAHEPDAGPFVTDSKCRLLKLHREDFHRLETVSPEIARQLRRKADEGRPAGSQI